MRVVSQDGQVDMPYDSIIINRDGGVVLANIVGEEEGAIVVAEYRDEKHAGSEMIRLRREYSLGGSEFKFKSEVDFKMRAL